MATSLSDLALGKTAHIIAVNTEAPTDATARRLLELGFVPGEAVRVITRAPFGGDPLLVQIGFTRFALRRSEANRIFIQEMP